MTKTLEAIYEDGVLKLSGRLPLPAKSRVTVTIRTPADEERETWMRVSEDKLTQAWDDSDDVFNELLKK
jgi:predicted DNA-binding antitoxin AbrB/MazE fold protein